MYKINEENIKFLLENIEPVNKVYTGEKVYRAAAELLDRTIISCIEFKSASEYVNTITSCFKIYFDEIYDKHNRDLINALFIHRNCISPFVLKEIIESPFVLPKIFREKLIEYADIMNIDLISSGLPFIVEMVDGKEFIFSFNENTEFIRLPEGYNSKQIINVIPKTKVKSKPLGNLLPFECYIDGL